MRKKFPYATIYWLIFISALPFLYLFAKPEVRGDFISNFASITGLLGLLLMIWQMLLSNRFLLTKFTPDYVASVKLHTLLGINGFFLIMIHPFLEMISYGEKLGFIFFPNLSTSFYKNVVLGQVSIGLFLIIWTTSALIRGRIKYRLWRYLHYLTYPIILLVLLHAGNIGIYLATFPLLKFYWSVLLTIFFIFTIYRMWQFFLNGGRSQYLLKNIIPITSEINYYVFSPKSKFINPQIGQFCFLKLNLYSESHPFTVADFNTANKELTFAIKNSGTYTNKLTKMKIGQSVYLDGPYGIFTTEGQNQNPKVIIAGGIGVTPFIDLIKNFSGPRTFMFNANRYLKDVVGRIFFKKKLGKNYIDIISRENINQEGVISGRINDQILTKYLTPEILQTALFFICGSTGFTTTTLGILNKLGINKERIFVEEFSF